jgi:hypothetical protein
VVKVRNKREDNSSSKLTIVQHLEETDYSIPDAEGNAKFADDADPDDKFRCVRCKEFFNSV